jgi:hypothetical protein
MSNDFSPIEPSNTEAPMFAGVPSWERGKTRRTFGSRGSRVAAEPRSFASEAAPIPTRPVTLSEDARAYGARMDTVDPTDTGFASGATFADRTTRKGNGAAPIMVAAGIILVGGLAAAGWYATQPHSAGVAELTPGSAATTTTTEVASTAPAPGEQQVAQNTVQTTVPAAAAPVRSTTTTTTTAHLAKPTASHATTTRVAPARSAVDVGANASAIAAPVRATPAPAPTAAPPAAAAPPAPLVLSIPAPAPTTSAPAEAPLPTQTAPAPAQTPPN